MRQPWLRIEALGAACGVAAESVDGAEFGCPRSRAGFLVVPGKEAWGLGAPSLFARPHRRSQFLEPVPVYGADCARTWEKAFPKTPV